MMKKIILCADDYGQNQPISQAIIALLEKNRLSATSCMTTSVFWPEHAKWLQPFTFQIDIGLHFNLTEGKPLSKELQGSHGFLPLPRLLLKAYGRLLNKDAVEAELNAQLDAFVASMGKLPDFVDGHQHVHQLPIVRDALLAVYNQRLRASHCYLRCVHEPKVYLRVRTHKDIKGLLIQLLGASKFKKMLIKHHIPHNAAFAGIYAFQDSQKYPWYFSRFLAQSKNLGIIMCHPGMQVADITDIMAKARFDEFVYLASQHFVLDCLHAGVVLGKMG